MSRLDLTSLTECDTVLLDRQGTADRKETGIMARITSASLYGSGTPTDLSRVNWHKPPRAYGLRSQSSLAGYYPAYGARPKRRTVRETIDRTTNLVAPVASFDDDYVPRVVAPRVTDGLVPVIRMGEWN